MNVRLAGTIAIVAVLAGVAVFMTSTRDVPTAATPLESTDEGVEAKPEVGRTELTAPVEPRTASFEASTPREVVDTSAVSIAAMVEREQARLDACIARMEERAKAEGWAAQHAKMTQQERGEAAARLHELIFERTKTWFDAQVAAGNVEVFDRGDATLIAQRANPFVITRVYEEASDSHAKRIVLPEAGNEEVYRLREKAVWLDLGPGQMVSPIPKALVPSGK